MLILQTYCAQVCIAFIAHPLHRLTQKHVPFETEECLAAFHTLKDALTSPPVMTFPGCDHSFIVQTHLTLQLAQCSLRFTMDMLQ